MTLYVVSGTGTMPTKELTAQLSDLWDKAEREDQSFWFFYTEDVATTKTGSDFIAFCEKNRVNADVTASPISIMETYADDEPVVLALFDMVDGELQPSDELLEFLMEAHEKGFKIFGLNDSLEPVVFTDAASETKGERPTKSEPEQEEYDPEPLDRIYLAGLTAVELRNLAEGMGIRYTNKDETIAKILGEEVSEKEPMLVEQVPAKKETVLEEVVIVVIHSSDGVRMTKVPASVVAHL